MDLNDQPKLTQPRTFASLVFTKNNRMSRFKTRVYTNNSEGSQKHLLTEFRK